jgi:hypothetical protein
VTRFAAGVKAGGVLVEAGGAFFQAGGAFFQAGGAGLGGVSKQVTSEMGQDS